MEKIINNERVKLKLVMQAFIYSEVIYSEDLF